LPSSGSAVATRQHAPFCPDRISIRAMTSSPESPAESGPPILSVRALVKQRLDERSKPGARSDGATLALVIEGGGMRGVVSGGMVTGLEQLALREVFDLVVGTSAGALAGAYFLADQSRVGTSIYYEDLTGKEWLDYSRALRRKPPVGLDYLLDDVMVSRKPLNWDAVLASAIPLYAVATHLGDYAATVFGQFRSGEQLRDALRASSRIPVISGAPVEIDGGKYIDGSLSQGVPLEAAMTGLGATHAVLLLTRPAGQTRGQPSKLLKLVGFPIMNRLLAGLGDAYSRRADLYLAELDRIARLQALPRGSPLLAIQLPAGGPQVRQLEQDPDRLVEGAAAGAAAVHTAITGETIDCRPLFERVR
jgi:predicted patatin/cPLA2 family phospholipase